MRPFLLSVIFILICAAPLLANSVDVRLLRSVPLGETPRQVVATADGQRIYVLTDAGKVHLFNAEGQSEGSFDVGPDVTGLTAQGSNRLVLQMAGRQELVLVALQPVVAIDTVGAPSLGNADAPVEIVIFDDFECPYCARAVPLLKEVLAAYPEQTRLVFKNFPLSIHKHARTAALAGLAAEQQGKFWPLHDQLFENYNRLNPQKIRELAEQVGLDMGRFDRAMADQQLQQQLNNDFQEGQRIGVRGTPTIFINGRRLQQRSMDGFKQMIEAELTKRKSDKES